MAGIGALLAGPGSDKFGRKKVIMLASIFFMISSIVICIAFDKWILLIGRLLVGFAIGKVIFVSSHQKLRYLFYGGHGLY